MIAYQSYNTDACTCTNLERYRSNTCSTTDRYRDTDRCYIVTADEADNETVKVSDEPTQDLPEPRVAVRPAVVAWTPEILIPVTPETPVTFQGTGFD